MWHCWESMSIFEENSQQRLPDEELTLDNLWVRNDSYDELALCKGQHLVQAAAMASFDTGKDADHCEDQEVAATRPRGLGYSSSFSHLRPVGGQTLLICQRKRKARVSPEDMELHFRGSLLTTPR